MHLNRKMQTGCFSPQYNLHIFTQFAALLKCPYSTFYTSYKITFVFVPIKLRVSYWFCHANANHRNIRYCHCRRRSYLLHSLPLYYCYHRTVSTANVLIRIIVISTIGFVQAKTIPICGWIFKFSLILMRSINEVSKQWIQANWMGPRCFWMYVDFIFDDIKGNCYDIILTTRCSDIFIFTFVPSSSGSRSSTDAL